MLALGVKPVFACHFELSLLQSFCRLSQFSGCSASGGTAEVWWSLFSSLKLLEQSGIFRLKHADFSLEFVNCLLMVTINLGSLILLLIYLPFNVLILVPKGSTILVSVLYTILSTIFSTSTSFAYFTKINFKNLK